jgi:hypothetical protein
VEGVEAVVVDGEEVMVEGRDRTADLEAGHRGAACRALLTAGRRLEHLRDEEVEEVGTVGVIVLLGEGAAAVEEVEVEAGEAPATARTAATARGTAVGVGIADEEVE